MEVLGEVREAMDGGGPLATEEAAGRVFEVEGEKQAVVHWVVGGDDVGLEGGDRIE